MTITRETIRRYVVCINKDKLGSMGIIRNKNLNV